VSTGPLHAGAIKGVAKQPDVLRNEWLAAPLVVVLREDLDGVHAQRGGGIDGFVVAAGYGHVGAEKGHVDRTRVLRLY
jgi:hypothetical protein